MPSLQRSYLGSNWSGLQLPEGMIQVTVVCQMWHAFRVTLAHPTLAILVRKPGPFTLNNCKLLPWQTLSLQSCLRHLLSGLCQWPWMLIRWAQPGAATSQSDTPWHNRTQLVSVTASQEHNIRLLSKTLEAHHILRINVSSK